MISFQNVTKRYNKINVLDNIDFTIESGEFVSVIGASGAGKSTLIHALIGGETINQGKIIVDGFVVNEMKERALQFYRRRIGVVFQDYKLLSQKTVYENVAFAMEVCGYEKNDIQKRVEEVLEIVGLKKQQKHFPHQLSGGEKQRVAIARALVHHPRLLVADEPTGNLDPKTAKEIIDLFLKINEAGITVILTTHNVTLVDFIKKRVIKLDNGKIISDRKKSGYHPKVKLEIQ